MAINRYYGKKPEGYKSIFDNYMVLNLKRTQFRGCLPIIVFLLSLLLPDCFGIYLNIKTHKI